MKPTLYVLVGLPASGKDYFCKYNMTNIPIVSSDALRKELFGDINDQTHNIEVFREFNRRLINLIKSGQSCVANATNLNRKKRISFLRNFDKLECKKVALVFATPYNVCYDRNWKRERTVPPMVLSRMRKQFTMPCRGEGFDLIQIVGCVGPKEDMEENLKINIATPHKNSHHHLSCGNHCLEAERLVRTNPELEFRRKMILSAAARYHDVSKYKCQTFMKNGVADVEAHYYGHENVSAYDYLCSDWKNAFSLEENIYIVNLINNHMVFFTGENSIRKRKELYSENFWKDLEFLHSVDMAAH